MTQRERQKSGRAASRTGARAARAAAPAADGSSIEQLQLERLDLIAKLAAAEATIKALESQRIEVLNRIDWVIDSLHNVLERQS